MNDYATTHLPILEFITEIIDCKNVFEFGMSNKSTTLFADKFQSVTSVEMQEENRFDIMNKEKLPSHVDLLCALGETPAIDIMKSMDQKFSCVFVDGHGGNRWQCINESFDKTDVIIAHDTETPCYNWHLVNKPPNFIWIDIKQYNPWTSVLTCNQNIIRALVKKFPSYVIRY